MLKDERVLVTGAGGLIGSYLLERLNERYENLFVVVHETLPKFGKRIYLDLANLPNVRKELNSLKPTTIINLAAVTDVEYCEKNPIQADIINHRLPKELAQYCNENNMNGSGGIFIIHISTDFVFDGKLGNYSEDSNPNPVNVYGKTKFLGDNAIRSIVQEQNWCIARFGSVFGLHPRKKTFPIFAIEYLLSGQRIDAAIDQINSPSYVVNVCDMLDELVRDKHFGTFHVGGASRLSRYEQAKKIAEVLRADASLIDGKTSVGMNWVAKRPPDSSLCVNKARRFLSSKPMEFDAAIRAFIKEIEMKGYFSS